MNAGVIDILRESARKWPDAPAIYDEYGTLTFAALLAEAETLRSRLTELGIRSHMGVGVMARNSRNFIIAIFAASGTGATVMPMSHQLKKSEVEEIIAEAKLHAILDDRSGVDPTGNAPADLKLRLEGFRFAWTGVPKSREFAPHVKDPAFIRFTSGTTGKAKGVLLSAQSVLERVDAANKALRLGPGDTVIWVLPMAYHFVVSIILYVRHGAAIAIAKDFLARNVIDITNRRKGTLLYASPMQIRLLAADPGTLQMDSLRMVISTSAAISADICKAFRARYGKEVSQAYGIIELGLPILNSMKMEEHPDAVGHALPDFEIAILDQDHQPVPNGTTGYLAMRGPGMFDAYLSPPVLRAEILRNGYFVTADYAVMDDTGLVKVQGREKSMINVSGNKVFAEEVEAVLETIPEIRLARISGVPHPLMGQIIQAELVLHEGKTIDVEEVLTYCRKRLSTYKIPQKVKIVDSLPMTGSGKIIRH